jgi:NTE family protein
MWGLVGGRDNLIDPTNLKNLIERHLPYSNLEEATISVHVIATNLGGAPVCLSSGPAVPAILASAAIPAAFPAVRIAGDDLVDGAVGSNTPILTAAKLGATRIIALPTGFACALQAAPRGAIARALHAITLLIAHQMVHDLTELAGTVEVFTVPSLCPLEVSPYDFSHAAELIEQSAQKTREWIEGGGLTRSEISASILPHTH